MIAVYHADLAAAQADDAIAATLARGHVPGPFDRIAWLRLMADECLGDRACFLAVARQDDAMAVLPLARGNAGLGPLGNWYSFTARPIFNAAGREQAPRLIAAIARSLARDGAIDLWPLPAAETRLMCDSLRATGWFVRAERCDSNHVLVVAGRTFDEYWATRPGALRETVRRKARKGTVEIRLFDRFDPAAWDAYETVYRSSWKPGEGSPAFLRRFAEAEGAAGGLRLGIGLIDGRPVAAQFWTVEANTAFIHKLAHDRAAIRYSPGTVLSAALFRQAIDRDRVGLIDFGTGDDAYKRDWTDAVRPRYRLRAVRWLSPNHRGLLARLLVTAVLAPQSSIPIPELQD